MTDSTDEDAPACQACTDPIPEDGERRVVTVVENGTVVHYQFCSATCLESWNRT